MMAGDRQTADKGCMAVRLQVKDRVRGLGLRPICFTPALSVTQIASLQLQYVVLWHYARLQVCLQK